MPDFQDSVDLTTCPWPESVKDDFRKHKGNACVGQILASENERMRIWHLRLAPGERISFHTHVLDYFWTCLSGGSARSHVFADSKFEVTQFDLQPGSTKYTRYSTGKFKIHDLENTGDIELVFVTVEFLDSDNQPLPVPSSVKIASHEGASKAA